MIMTCDNDCTRAGWTEALIVIGQYDLHISYAPETGLDNRFKAFCHDEQEMIIINGWMIENVEIIPA